MIKRMDEKRIDVIDQLAHDMASPVSFLDQYVNNFSLPKDDCSIDDIKIDEVAKRSIKRVRDMLDQMRDFAKTVECEKEVYDFAAVIKSSLAEASAKANILNVKLHYDGPDVAEGDFDKDSVERAIANVITNAIESVDGNGGTVNVSLVQMGSSVMIEVSDDGMGIPAELHDKIFERGATFGKEGGTGLGLYYTKEVMEAHGGSLNVESEIGKGTNISLIFTNVVENEFSATDYPAMKRRDHFIGTPGEITLDLMEF